ncbi:switch-associated protein 70 [Lepeophtheirus salmonis]|nr:switch-associated protein 70-like [Lepeophtheirus salmonis]
MSDKMSENQLLDSVENSIWHAFDFLSLEGDGTAPKSKLKTLTSQIGDILDINSADLGLDDYRSTDALNFEQYRYYLCKEVFSNLPDEIPVNEQHSYESKTDNVCWEWCSLNFIKREGEFIIFPDHCVYQLYRIFCMLGEMVENDKGHVEVIMAAEEVENVVFQFMNTLGRGQDWNAEEFDSIASVIPAFKFGIFLTVLESKYTKDTDKGGLIEAVRDIHDFFVLDVVKKGHLGKKMDFLPAYREHFFVLQPNLLSFYNGTSQREKRGDIVVDGQCRVEVLEDVSNRIPIKSPGSKSHSKFQLFAQEKNYIFQAPDHRTRLQWVSSLKTSINQSGHPIRYQRRLAETRRLMRQEEKEKLDVELLKQTDTMEETRAQLELEKQARINAEVQAETLMEQCALESEKTAELEKIRTQLESLLDEERQAKKDEETVRRLQARILNEEWERRDFLEKLQEEQKNMLEEERKKRSEFEKMQQDKENQLNEAQKRVEEMERERKRLDNQLRVVQEKTKRANIGQEVLEAQIKVKEQEREKDLEKEASSRLTTLNPSASFYVRNRGERSAYTPMRSASMRETSYSRSIRRRNRNNDSVSITISQAPSTSNIQEAIISESITKIPQEAVTEEIATLNESRKRPLSVL